MSMAEPQIIPFQGERVQYVSDKPFAELLVTFRAAVGERPMPLDDLSAAAKIGWEAYRALVEARLEGNDFMLFGLVDHGEWIRTTGIDRDVVRAIIGNPLIAITMLRHDVKAGLFAPVELLLVGEDDDRSSLTYVKPSSLIVVADNPPLLAAAQVLDDKLATLAAAVTGS